jgi:hypothetical protein
MFPNPNTIKVLQPPPNKLDVYDEEQQQQSQTNQENTKQLQNPTAPPLPIETAPLLNTTTTTTNQHLPPSSSSSSCHICSRTDGQLITACLCGKVHRECLDQDRINIDIHGAFWGCPTCRTEYIFIQRDIPEEKSVLAKARCEFFCLVVKDLGLILLIWQLLIGICGMIIYGFDSTLPENDQLRNLSSFQNWDDITIYYMFGTIIFFAILGFVFACSELCCGCLKKPKQPSNTFVVVASEVPIQQQQQQQDGYYVQQAEVVEVEQQQQPPPLQNISRNHYSNTRRNPRYYGSRYANNDPECCCCCCYGNRRFYYQSSGSSSSSDVCIFCCCDDPYPTYPTTTTYGRRNDSCDKCCDDCCKGCTCTCDGCCKGGGSSTGSASSSSSSSKDDCGIMLIILAVVVLIFACIGFIYGLFVFIGYAKMITSRHWHASQLKCQRKVWVVHDLSVS